MTLRISENAERDLETIWCYLASVSKQEEIASSVVHGIVETCEFLARNPGAGSKRDALRPGLRGFPVGKYIIYYWLQHDAVLVARILHAMRDQPRAYLAWD